LRLVVVFEGPFDGFFRLGDLTGRFLMGFFLTTFRLIGFFFFEEVLGLGAAALLTAKQSTPFRKRYERGIDIC
jgi:hypothetical protein